MAKKRRARKAMVATAAAAGMSGTLVLGHAVNYTAANLDVALSATVIGVGGRDDPTSTRLKDKLDGNYALGFDTTNYVPITYPANLQFQTSIDDGVPKLAQAVRGGSGNIRVVAYSEGTLVAEQVKRNLANPKPGDPTPPPAGTLDFVLIASPYVPNGGVFGRFPGFKIPGLLPEFSAAQPSAYNSTYVTNEYDGFADFPAYFNPLSIANAVLGMAYAHPDQYYDGIDLATATKYTYTQPQPNALGGRDTYVLVYNPHLPLLAPLRQIASLLALTPLTEPVLGAIEPLLRVMVDMGYTDRTNAHPDTPTAFSFLTPPAKLIEAINAVPGALAQGAASLPSGGQPPLPISPGLTQVSPTPQGIADANRMQIASDPQEPQQLGDQQDPQTGSGDLDPTEPLETSSAPTPSTGSPAPPSTNPAPATQTRLPKLRMPTPADFLRPHVTTGGSLFVPGRPAPSTNGTTPTGGTATTTVDPTTTTTTTSGPGSETTGSAPGNSAGDGQAAA